MDRRRRSSLAAGLVLILLGAWFLVAQWVPGLQTWFSWPLTIVGVGVLLLIIGLLTRVPAMAVPACIVGGIGGLLYWQNATGNWESWAYAWTLIPGFVGVGIVLSGLLGGEIAADPAGLADPDPALVSVPLAQPTTHHPGGKRYE
jgi:hypothetical protein